MEIKIQTLTPLWTGGVKTGTMNRIQETGIIGGLRWWYEAMLRGMGRSACDPRQDGCGLNVDEYEKAKKEDKENHKCLSQAGLCDACQLFGATGYRRRFSIRVQKSKSNLQPAWKGWPPVLNVRPPNRSRGWYLPPGSVGEFSLQVEGEPEALRHILQLFRFLEQYGSLGAKPQLGYGCFRILEVDRPPSPGNDLQKGNGDPASQKDLALPNLLDFQFFRLTFQPDKGNWWTYVHGLERLLGNRESSAALSRLASAGMVPAAPALKNLWRYGYEEKIPAAFDVFGSLNPNRIRSKIAVSWAYKFEDSWRIHGWTWLPRSLPQKTRNAILNRIQDGAVWGKALGISRGKLEITDGLDAENQMEG